MYNLELKFPQDFEERYNEYKERLGIVVSLDPKDDDESEKGKNPIYNKPSCQQKGKRGYLKFPNNELKEISLATSQPYKLLLCLSEPEFGISKTIDSVFESIRENIRPDKKRGVMSVALDKRAKSQLIQNVIKLCQKDKKLKGKTGEIIFKWDEMKNKIWLEFLPKE